MAKLTVELIFDIIRLHSIEFKDFHTVSIIFTLLKWHMQRIKNLIQELFHHLVFDTWSIYIYL